MRTHVLIAMLCLTASCVSDVDLDLPSYRSNFVLNALLTPDSLIKVHLSHSSPLSDSSKSFREIRDARVLLFIDDVESEKLNYEGMGYYKSTHAPEAGHKYAVRVKIGTQELYAEDVMPQNIAVSTIVNNEKNDSQSAFVKIMADVLPSEEHFLWFTCMQKTFFSDFSKPFENVIDTTKIISSEHGFYTNSLLPDRGLKTGYWLGYQGYDFGVRVQMRNATGSILLEDCKLNFAQFHYLNADGSYTVASSINEKIPEKIGLFVRLISGSRAFDRYMKNSVIQIAYRPEPEQLNPFYQAVPVYSNVRGGTGIFAAYTQSLQKIRP